PLRRSIRSAFRVITQPALNTEILTPPAQVAADRFAHDAYRSCMEAAKLGTVIRDGKPVSPAEQQAECGPEAQSVREKELAYRNANDAGAEKRVSQAVCVKRWTDAYMRNPMNAGVTTSQIQQWEGFCQQGRLPN
ncbi:hypothetical protein, partial [Burkholderia multivorans]|uniref:hypothetical protein n=1 Tax=Burkholderia multivorans TaxID=87883 RepID=UPI001C611E72